MPKGLQSFVALTLRTVVVHTVTYFVAGLLAFVLLRYGQRFAEPALSSYMRQTDDPWVMAGPLFQPLRGVLFASVFYLLREQLFGHRRCWLLMWWLLVVLGILSTFGPSPSSVEGMIYTRLSWRDHLFGLPETVVQALLLSVLLCYWMRHPEKRWLNWLLGVLFVLTMLLPALGLVAQQARPH